MSENKCRIYCISWFIALNTTGILTKSIWSANNIFQKSVLWHNKPSASNRHHVVPENTAEEYVSDFTSILRLDERFAQVAITNIKNNVKEMHMNILMQILEYKVEN